MCCALRVGAEGNVNGGNCARWANSGLVWGTNSAPGEERVGVCVSGWHGGRHGRCFCRRRVGVGGGAAEQRGGGTHAGPCEASGLVGTLAWPGHGDRGRVKDPVPGRVRVLGTDLMLGNKARVPPASPIPRTRALFTHDFAFAFTATPLKRQRSSMDEGTETQSGQTDGYPKSQGWV